MIDVTELRIGNLVETEGGAKKISGILSEKRVLVEVDGENVGYDASQIKAIQFTEGWAQRFGFDKYLDVTLNWEKGTSRRDVTYTSHAYEFEAEEKEEFFVQVKFIRDPKSDILRNIQIVGLENFMADCDCVHEFQNLYFSIYGEEIQE